MIFIPLIISMNRMLFLFSVCIGTFIYSAVAIVGGQNGLWAYAQLEKQNNVLVKNVENIEIFNEILKTKHALLKQDPEVLAAYAKRLGFVHDGEKIIKITGLSITPDKVDEIGALYIREKIQFIPEWICKLMGLTFFLLTYFIGVLRSVLLKQKNHEYCSALCEQYQIQ